jgi:hypothetical protein
LIERASLINTWNLRSASVKPLMRIAPQARSEATAKALEYFIFQGLCIPKSVRFVTRPDSRGSKPAQLRISMQLAQRRAYETFCLTGQTICCTLPPMLDPGIRRLLGAYPAIFLACHRQHVREDEAGKSVTEHQASVLDHLQVARPTTLSKLAEHMG